MVLELGDILLPVAPRHGCACTEDPEPTDDLGVLPVVQDFQLCANWAQYQLLRLEVTLSVDEAEGNCKRRGQKSPSARHS